MARHLIFNDFSKVTIGMALAVIAMHNCAIYAQTRFYGVETGSLHVEACEATGAGETGRRKRPCARALPPGEKEAASKSHHPLYTFGGEFDEGEFSLIARETPQPSAKPHTKKTGEIHHSVNDQLNMIVDELYLSNVKRISQRIVAWETATTVLDCMAQILACVPSCVIIADGLCENDAECRSYINFGAGLAGVLSVCLYRGAKFAKSRAAGNIKRMNLLLNKYKIKSIPNFLSFTASSPNTRHGTLVLR